MELPSQQICPLSTITVILCVCVCVKHGSSGLLYDAQSFDTLAEAADSLVRASAFASKEQS